jgi:FAD:protein FMN transferase
MRADLSPGSARPALLAMLALFGALASSGTEGSTVERRLTSMGTWLTVRVEADDREAALAGSEAIVGALEATEARLSTWRPGTELALLNRAPAGEPRTVSPELAAELAAARRCWEATGGAFDPAIGALVAAWGLREGGRRPAEAERRAAVGAGGMEAFGLLPDGRVVRERPGAALEEGGFGKGAGLARALEAAAAAPGVARAEIDLGGQISVFERSAHPGSPPTPFEVAVADPRRRESPAVAVAVDGGSVATSGNSERGIVVGGERLGHILDPRTGEPVPDFGSVTVWSHDPLVADCLSTGLYVIGPERALEWAARHPEVEVLVLRPRDGNRLEALASAGLRGKLRPLAGGIDLVFGSGEEAEEARAADVREGTRFDPPLSRNPRGAPTPRKP